MTQKTAQQFGQVDPTQENPMSAASQGCGCGGCGCGGKGSEPRSGSKE